MNSLMIFIILQVITIIVLSLFIVIWYRRVGSAISILKALESIKAELADERLALKTYQTENSDLTFRLLTESRRLRHCYRDCGEYQNDINGLRAKLKLPLIEFKPPGAQN